MERRAYGDRALRIKQGQPRHRIGKERLNRNGESATARITCRNGLVDKGAKRGTKQGSGDDAAAVRRSGNGTTRQGRERGDSG